MPLSSYPSPRYLLSYTLVRQFHNVFKHPVETEVTPNTVAHRRLRVALIAEELGELCQALGVPLELSVVPAALSEATDKDVANNMRIVKWVAPAEMCHPDGAVDLVEAADALGDLDYVVQGSNLVFGFPGPAVVEEIHDSNMTKLGADGKPIWDEMGKIVKGPNYRRPDVGHILMRVQAKELWAEGQA